MHTLSQTGITYVLPDMESHWGGSCLKFRQSLKWLIAKSYLQIWVTKTFLEVILWWCINVFTEMNTLQSHNQLQGGSCLHVTGQHFQYFLLAQVIPFSLYIWARDPWSTALSPAAIVGTREDTICSLACARLLSFSNTDTFQFCRTVTKAVAHTHSHTMLHF